MMKPRAGNSKQRRNLHKPHFPGMYRTKRLPGGRLRTSFVEFQGIECPTRGHQQPSDQCAVSQDVDSDTGHLAQTSSTQPPCSYYDRKGKVIEEWASVRSELLSLASVTEALPTDAICCLCGDASEAVVRCRDCGPMLLWCGSCAIREHVMRPYHVLEQWSVSVLTRNG